MNAVRRLGWCLLTLLPVAAAAAQATTFAGATLAQWLRPGLPTSGVAMPPELGAEMTRERALRAFGIEGEPIAFLHRIVGDPGNPATLDLVLEAIPELPARDQFAKDLLARWRLHKDHAGTLQTLLAVDAMAWLGIEGELRAVLAQALKDKGAAAVFDSPFWRVVPTDAVSANADWARLLGQVLDGLDRLPAPADLAPVFRSHPRLVPAILRLEGGQMPKAIWLDVLQVCAPELAPQLPQLEATLRAELKVVAASVALWRRYADHDPPELDPGSARLLGIIGGPALGLVDALLQDPDANTYRAGLLALGQMACAEPAARQRLVALVREEAIAAAKLRLPGAPPRSPLVFLPNWPLPRTSRAALLHEALRIAGEPIVGSLLPLLRAGEPDTMIAALDGLRSLWALPYSFALGQLPRAVPQLDPILPLLDVIDADVREAALLVAVGVAPLVRITTPELAKLDTQLQAATHMTSRLHVGAWRCWPQQGAWLVRVAERCRAPVAESLRLIASTSSGVQPLAPELPTVLHGLYSGVWYQRVRGCERAAQGAAQPQVQEVLARLRASDPDLLVRERARLALAKLGK